MHKIEMSITSHVSLTIATLPNPFTGERGLVAQPCIVVGRTLNLERGDITLTLVMLPSRNLGRWCPSGQVAFADKPEGLVVTLEESAFTPGHAAGTVPERDAAGFVAGDRVMLLDADLKVISFNFPPTVKAVEPDWAGNNKIALSHHFRDADGDIIRTPGMIVTYCHWAKGDAPNTTWTDSMQNQVAQGDEATGTLPDGSPSYLYGM